MSGILEQCLSGTDHVVVEASLVPKTVTHIAGGAQTIEHDPPVVMYFVTVHEADGGSICLWDGRSYKTALDQADQASIDWGHCAVIDRTQE